MSGRPLQSSRPLRSRFEGWLDGEHLECQQEKKAQNHPQPGEDEPKIVADGTQDDVGGIAGATSEIAAAEMTLCLHMSDHRRRLSSRLIRPKTPRFWPEM